MKTKEDLPQSYKEIAEMIIKELMKEDSGATNLKSLLKKEHSPFSYGQYQNIMRGVNPGQNTQRKMQTYMEKNLGLTFRDTDGQVQVVRHQTINIRGDYNFKSGDYSERLNFLLDELQELKLQYKELQIRFAEVCEENKSLRVKSKK